MNKGNYSNELIEKIALKGDTFLENNQPVQASRCYRMAADQAKTDMAFADAAELLTQSLSLTPDNRPEHRYALLIERQAVYGQLGRRQLQEQDLVSLSTLANLLNDDQRQVEVASQMAAYKFDSGAFQDALTIIQLALSLAERIGTVSHQTLLFQVWGRILMRQGDFATAELHLQKALQNAAAVHDHRAQADTLRHLGVLCSNQSEFAAAQQYYQQALTLSVQLGDESGRANVLNNLGNIAKMQGRIGAALAYWEDAKVIYETLEDKTGLCRLLVNQSAGCITVGFYAEARRHSEAALAISKEIELQFGQAISNLNLAVVHFYQEAPRTAEIYATAALELAQKMSSPQLEGYALNILGRIHHQADEYDQAAEAFWQALMLWRELERPSLEMETRAGMAQLALATGDSANARLQVEAILNHLNLGRSLDGTESDLAIFLTCYQLLESQQDERAPALLRKAKQLLGRRANQIDCAETKESFLFNNKVHATLAKSGSVNDSQPAVS